MVLTFFFFWVILGTYRKAINGNQVVNAPFFFMNVPQSKTIKIFGNLENYIQETQIVKRKTKFWVYDDKKNATLQSRDVIPIFKNKSTSIYISLYWNIFLYISLYHSSICRTLLSSFSPYISSKRR